MSFSPLPVPVTEATGQVTARLRRQVIMAWRNKLSSAHQGHSLSNRRQVAGFVGGVYTFERNLKK